jgi:hypothetical protein
MPDPVPSQAVPAADALEGRARDARVEELLLAGLDQYFAGQYEQAIHLWTRVLFLDRGHARGRAYIDRARSALAERQRESDELLHRGTAAFEQGEAAAARRLLMAAVEGGAPPDVALGYLGRLDRLEPFATVSTAVASDRRREVRHQAAVGPRRVGVPLRSMAVAALVLGAVAWWSGVANDLVGGWRPAIGRQAAPYVASVESLPVPRASDRTLARARLLAGAGHPSDALRALAAIPAADPNRPEADRLLADIQRTLLSAADPSAAETVSTVR